MARLDRLASVRLVAQIGAAIGREFSYDLLRAVSHLSERELEAALVRLVASELVFQRGAPPEALYTFKHALVQDAAHGSLLRSSRQQLHAQIADALETHFPELMDSQPELFALHYTEAGLIEKSVEYWARAGRRSAARSAMAEAAAQFQKGLDQLALLPDDSATPAAGTRNMERLRRCISVCQRSSRTGDGACLRPRKRIVGAAGFPLGVPPHSLRAVHLSYVSRRIRFGAAAGQRFAASEPGAPRFRRPRSGSRFPLVETCYSPAVCVLSVPFRRGACAL